MTNPPGSASEQLPPHILALLAREAYLSTACETADLLNEAITRHPERDDLPAWRNVLHARCRLNHKFTGEPCFCMCHPTEREKDHEQQNQQEAGLGADRTEV